MEKILVTGGAGFIGSHLVDFYIKDYEVFVLDDLSMGSLANLPDHSNLRFIEGSVKDENLLTEIIKDNQFKYIFHLAAVASVQDSIERPIETNQVNSLSTLYLLELVRKYQTNIEKMIFSSSAAVYGDEEKLPKHETDGVLPLTPYAIDKYSSERYMVIYQQLHQIPTVAVRFFNVYGERQNPNSPYSGVISIITDKFINQKQGADNMLNVYGDGEQTRDFVNVADVINALVLVAKSADSKGNVYNIGQGKQTSLNEIIKIYEDIAGIKLKVNYQESRLGDIKDSLADIGKIQILGYTPKVDITAGLTRYWNYVYK